MSLRMVWAPPALRVFYDLAPHEAMVVDRAVIRFAEKGEGNVVRIGPHFSMRVGRVRVQFSVVTETGTMNVLYLYRSH